MITVILFTKKSRKWGLKQLVNTVTRPNNHGGSCIDHIISNSPFVSKSGVLDDMIADHFTVYAIRKKQKERKQGVC